VKIIKRLWKDLLNHARSVSIDTSIRTVSYRWEQTFLSREHNTVYRFVHQIEIKMDQSRWYRDEQDIASNAGRCTAVKNRHVRAIGSRENTLMRKCGNAREMWKVLRNRQRSPQGVCITYFSSNSEWIPLNNRYPFER